MHLRSPKDSNWIDCVDLFAPTDQFNWQWGSSRARCSRRQEIPLNLLLAVPVNGAQRYGQEEPIHSQGTCMSSELTRSCLLPR